MGLVKLQERRKWQKNASKFLPCFMQIRSDFMFMDKNEDNWPDCSEKNPRTQEEEVLPNTAMLFPMTAREDGRRVKGGDKAGPGQHCNCSWGATVKKPEGENKRGEEEKSGRKRNQGGEGEQQVGASQ